ncbi:MAG: radical SAM protein [Elusimicrobia bacterium]|nr:radical SAM protein [Elusimicrobiota bacterium]MBU2615168.1 radical SAM protein [Elusimicrobiota bacterium]
MRILLLNPPGIPGFTANRDFMGEYGMLHFGGGTVLPPHSLLLLASFLKEKNEIKFIDAVAEKIDSGWAIKEVKDYNPDIVFLNTSTPTADYDFAISKQIKNETKSKIVLVGPHPVNTVVKSFEASGADCILINNLPQVAKNVVKAFEKNEQVSSFEGAYFKKGMQIIGTTAKAYNLEEFPFPNWEIAPLKKYFYLYKNEYPYATMHSSIGCVFRCKFCPYPVSVGFKYAEMSAKRVVAEMEYLVNDIGVKMILFRDSLFTAHKGRIKEICKLVMARKLKVKWRCETSTGSVDEELLSMMKQAGCVCINFGIESVVTDVADEMNCDDKIKSLDNVKKVFKICRKLKIETFAFFVHGLPNDKKETIEKNTQFAIELNPDHVQFTFATPFPGTELYAIAKKEGLIVSDKWETYSSLVPVMKTRYLTAEEVSSLNKQAYGKFFIRPGRLLKECLHPLRLVRRALTYLSWVQPTRSS